MTTVTKPIGLAAQWLFVCVFKLPSWNSVSKAWNLLFWNEVSVKHLERQESFFCRHSFQRNLETKKKIQPFQLTLVIIYETSQSASNLFWTWRKFEEEDVIFSDSITSILVFLWENFLILERKITRNERQFKNARNHDNFLFYIETSCT